MKKLSLLFLVIVLFGCHSRIPTEQHPSYIASHEMWDKYSNCLSQYSDQIMTTHQQPEHIADMLMTVCSEYEIKTLNLRLQAAPAYSRPQYTEQVRDAIKINHFRKMKEVRAEIISHAAKVQLGIIK